MAAQISACGLISVDPKTSVGKKLAEKLQAESGDILNKDMVRPCVCGKKTIVYAHNMTKVNKLCMNCGVFESKISVVS